jgi:peptide/nickel transport system ATP-binding protein
MKDAFDTEKLLSAENLTVSYRTYRGLLAAVDNVNISLDKGRIHALVGESGCGKSTLGLALSRLLPENQVAYSGRLIYRGVDILSLSEDEVERFRGTHIATVFQEPMTSLNPVYRVGEQLAEAISVKESRTTVYTKGSSSIGKPEPMNRLFGVNQLTLLRGRGRMLYQKYSEEVHELLRKVRIPNPDRVANMYPHELSGGMNQRVMIAMALAEKPSLLVADEPTTALDVTTQAQILRLIQSLTKEFDMGVLLITHDLGVVAAVAEYASVMYAGKIVEEAPAKELFENPLHPYTLGLMASFPRGRKDSFKLRTIPGTVPPLGRYPAGCRFHPRCDKAFQRCFDSAPELVEVSRNHRVACYLY